MPVWALLVWSIIGGIAGLVAPKVLVGQSAHGLLGDLVMGLVGALLGGYGLSPVLPVGIQGTVGGLLATLVAALIGAVLLIWFVRLLKMPA